MKEHTVETMFRNEVCQVDRCSCGQYHVSLGKMTVHMSAPQFFNLAGAIQAIDWESVSARGIQ
ncbi:MAG: hypothetical protein KDK25_10875 [Leptospiraceae bacterium]|nr:hypothetical protein [Leptospiraceae bacterium]MCB1170832.1 hypothetical protein [Leptospiraceae bacterium]